MHIEIVITWFMALVPLSMSPGPANILFAASGSSFGIRRTIPFWFGTNIICIFQTFLVGLGLGIIINNYPQTLEIIKYLGVILLLYLAVKLFRASINSQNIIKPLKFTDGIIIEVLNVKFLMIPAIMFSQFYLTGKDSYSRIVELTIILALLTILSNLVWIIAGKALTSLIAKKI